MTYEITGKDLASVDFDNGKGKLAVAACVALSPIAR
ncbi:hypothetical protein FHS38_001694 [Streptomyces netropsis]|uniref:Uncharacterized protein n=1 Tax=Streptomyces netropsis TaxID=55404 RepID=A0A7W7PEH5_STRNE|nr:hypothetical protein [Streptomyces netropsis]